ncbi:MAG: FHA domain-containing protein [Pyrinomonadaceae bacterium]|nr:FHA domain-containing protein [Pyrinomonadaceae bacterium]
MANLKITDAGGREWQFDLSPQTRYTIGRAPTNQIVLQDPRASRHHAEIISDDANFTIVDGHQVGEELRRSINRLFVNDQAHLEKNLEDGDVITIGASKLVFEHSTQFVTVKYDDKPLGQTQLFISANDVMNSVRSRKSAENGATKNERELEDLRRKAKILELLYEMSKTVSTAFDLPTIFDKATEIIFQITPADRVVALLKNEKTAANEIDAQLQTIATKARTPELTDLTKKLTVSRTITSKAMNEGFALLSQDTRSDSAFSGIESIVSQGVRSTICAPLVTENATHGVLYADRLDPFATFSVDDLQLLSAIAAQTAIAVETIKAHERLSKEEVARANYSRFMPEYVVKQILEQPDAFKLGGTIQNVTVLFADIRGFTRMSEREKPQKILSLLNRYFSEMTEIIFEHGGTLDKYIGDGLMALFGAPTATAKDAENAVRAAVTMQRRLIDLNEDLHANGFEKIGIGIGLHTGEAIVGYMGSEKRSEYTAIGDTVNLAARLESNALAGQILLSEATASAASDSFTFISRTSITVRNRTQPVPLLEVEWK